MMATQKRQARIQTVTYEGQDYHVELKPHQGADAARKVAEDREKVRLADQDRLRKVRRNTYREVTDPWRLSDTRFASWIKTVEDQREGMHVNRVELKDSFMRHLDRFTAYKAVKLMEAMYPRYAEVFALAYPLDDAIGLRDARDAADEKCITQEEIAARLHLSQPTVSRYLDKGRFFFKTLYLGVIDHPAIETDDRDDQPGE